MYSLTDYDYHLPEELIAQKPVTYRDQSRLLVLQRSSDRITHGRFSDLIELLNPGEVLVLNDTEVVPGRLIGRKSTGGKVEVLILDYSDNRAKQNRYTCRCLLKSSKPAKPGCEIDFDQRLKAEVTAGRDGLYTLEFICQGRFEDHLYTLGQVPLPPYIKRDADTDERDADRQRYQTVYAAHKGAVAAPTAGLHFTDQLLEALQDKKIEVVRLTLHVGYGTFSPVRVADIRQHRMHVERFTIPEASAKRINDAKSDGRRIIAVGTTCVRTLEFAAESNRRVTAGSGECDLFIYPGFQFKVIDAMITNFHLPQSTLMMLVSAFVGREKILGAYRQAIKNRYRFYSYGDAMLIY